MDPRDRIRETLAGVGCTACGVPVPAERILVLAEREDLVFVEVRCAMCGSEALGLVGMEERALALGGRLELRSAAGEGTSVGFECPVALRAPASAA